MEVWNFLPNFIFLVFILKIQLCASIFYPRHCPVVIQILGRWGGGGKRRRSHWCDSLACHKNVSIILHKWSLIVTITSVIDMNLSNTCLHVFPVLFCLNVPSFSLKVRVLLGVRWNLHDAFFSESYVTRNEIVEHRVSGIMLFCSMLDKWFVFYSDNRLCFR